MINPWIYYMVNEPDRIPDLNPHDKNEYYGYLGGIIGFIMASIIFCLLQYFTLKIKIKFFGYINIDMLFCLYILNVIIYVILIIVFMKISFKITDKIDSKKL